MWLYTFTHIDPVREDKVPSFLAGLFALSESGPRVKDTLSPPTFKNMWEDKKFLTGKCQPTSLEEKEATHLPTLS